MFIISTRSARALESFNPVTRLLRYSTNGSARLGVLTADGTGVVDATARLDGIDDVPELLSGPGLGAVRGLEDEDAQHAITDVTFERLVRAPPKIFCIGVNYGGRANEYADKSDAAYPSVFPRFADSFTGHEQPLVRPPESPQLDYEGEIVVVIGRSGRRIPMAESRNYIAALTLGNEGTIRDWVRHAKFNVTQGKNWSSSGAIGPWLVPIDEFDDLEDLELSTHVNGEQRQHDNTASMKYSIAYQVHYLSTFTDLSPGDLIFTGTPTGAGARQDPPVWLEPGHVIEVSVPHIGTLRNTVVDEFEPGTPQAAFAAPEPQ